MSKDRSTVVSIVPFEINEYKPGLNPPSFFFEKCEDPTEPVCLIIEPNWFYVPVPDHPQKNFRIEVNSESLADSICRDFLNSQLARDTDSDAEPGIFWVPEAATPSIINGNYREELNHAKARQERWFIALVKMADDDYERTRRHETISDFQRHAARALNLERPWILDSTTIKRSATKTCPVCTAQVLAESIVCPTCKAILDEQKYKTFKFAA
jgi:hypothetical protein